MSAMTFDGFVADRLPALLRFAGVLTGDRQLAEDIAQDVLVKAHRGWDRIGGLDHPESYVRKMIVNEFVSWRRKWARIVPSERVADDCDAAPDHAERIADRADLADRLARLAPKQRTVIVLRYYEDLPDGDIAAILGCTEGTVRGYASRALQTMRVDAAAPLVPTLSERTLT